MFLLKCVKDNDTIHSSTDMAPSRVTNADVLAIWRRMEAKKQRVGFATAKFSVGQHVRNNKQTIRLAMNAEQNLSTEIFKYYIEVRGRSVN